MSKDELVQKIILEAKDNNIDKDFIIQWLSDNYPSEEGMPEGFDKIGEMHKTLSLIEAIEIAHADEKTMCVDSVKDLIYSIALINAKKSKIDIFKVRDACEIDRLFKEYNIK